MGNARVIRNGLDPVPAVEHASGGDMITQQHMRDETDINTIVAQYMKTGLLGNPNITKKAYYGDFTTSQDYHTAVNSIADANQAFAALPSRVRDRFNNDPYQVLRFLDNPANLAEAIKLGLVPEPVVTQTPQTTPPVEAPKTP